MNEDIFLGCGVEVSLSDPDDFLKIRETLTRIGVPSKKDNSLYQTAHILHKRGRYVILHFKELFHMDGKPTDITDNDLARRNTIVKLLSDWNLLKIVKLVLVPEPIPISQLKIVSHKDKHNFTLVPKYSIGNSKREYK